MAKRPKKPDRRVIVSAKVPPELLERFKTIAGAQRRTVSQVIALLLEGYVSLYDDKGNLSSNWESHVGDSFELIFPRDFLDLLRRDKGSGEQTTPPVSDKKPIKTRPHD